MMQKYDTPAAITAVLDIPAGHIQIIAADRTDTAVEILPTDATKARDVKAAEQTTIAFGDDVLRISAPTATLGSTGSITVTIQLPTGSRIDATSAAAQFRSVGRLGDIACDGAHTAVEIDQAAQVRVTAHAADITIDRLAGPADISTDKGDIHIAEATTGTVVLRTQTGDVTIGAAPGVSASLDAATPYGRVHNALTNTAGSADLSIHATTQHGDITARSL